jgi:hypothetical protein
MVLVNYDIAYNEKLCIHWVFKLNILMFLCNREAPTHAAVNQESTSPGSGQPKASFLCHSVSWLLDAMARESRSISADCFETGDGTYLQRKRCTPNECRVPSSKLEISRGTV